MERNKKWQVIQSPHYRIATTGFLCALLFIVFIYFEDSVITPWIERFDNRVYDVLVRHAMPAAPQFPTVVIVDINQEAIEKIGPWPWSYKEFSALLGILKQKGVVTIALDIAPVLPVAWRSVLYDAKIVSGFSLQHPVYGSHPGFIDYVADRDGVLRHTRLLAQDHGAVYPSFALAIAMHYLILPHRSTHQAQRAGSTQGITSDALSETLIPYWKQTDDMHYYSALDVLHRKVPAKDLKDAIVIIGSSLPLFSHMHQTPQGTVLPDVAIVAHIVKGIVGERMMHEYQWHSAQGIGIFIMTALMYAVFFLFLGTRMMFLISCLSFLGLIIVLYLLFQWHDVYLPTGYLFLLLTIQTMVNFSLSFMSERGQRKKISDLFGQYVPAHYVQSLIAAKGMYDMSGETRNMTILFADICNFTTMSEKLDAGSVKALLNTFFTPLTKIIFDYQGTIDKYVGDMIIAFWGAPLADHQHTEHALQAAVHMVRALPEINAALQQRQLPSLRFGIGLSAGMVNVGDMGSAFRRAYTVIGDSVNLAARLQELTRYYYVTTLVSEEIRHGHETFIWRYVDKVIVRGRKKSVRIYELLGSYDDLSPMLEKALSDYEVALTFFYARQWDAARTILSQLHADFPDVYVYRMYLDRITQLSHKVLPADWDGIHVHARQ